MHPIYFPPFAHHHQAKIKTFPIEKWAKEPEGLCRKIVSIFRFTAVGFSCKTEYIQPKIKKNTLENEVKRENKLLKEKK